MQVKLISDYENEVADIRHALRISASQAEYNACVRKLNAPVKFECPLGEAVSNLAGFAWVWKMRGLLKPEPIVESDRFNAQGIEGKVSIPCTLYDALFYAMQAEPNRSQIRL